MDKELSLEELWEAALLLGATHIHFQDLEFDDDGPDWHFDIYAGDPHRWFRIYQPWTFRMSWRGFKDYYGKLQFPIRFFCWSWLFTKYGTGVTEGCQMVGGRDMTMRQRFAHALNHFACAIAEECGNDCGFTIDEDECASCPFKNAFTDRGW